MEPLLQFVQVVSMCILYSMNIAKSFPPLPNEPGRGLPKANICMKTGSVSFSSLTWYSVWKGCKDNQEVYRIFLQSDTLLHFILYIYDKRYK